ncbi:hypothetical protein FT641_20255 [Bacillus paranthracis]|uniref:hypothetical protein n=1 Tax=Bacillus paranthracis TaxID=2026186 RepID=UPI00187A2AE6|nr:hypothetical protein [Bacillus paranthracis]MBE7114604.1 hypothetical protein [Bacillus paranthracis]MBE7155029.1 hypothetical protein [Bacillus paranthracis]
MSSRELKHVHILIIVVSAALVVTNMMQGDWWSALVYAGVVVSGAGFVAVRSKQAVTKIGLGLFLAGVGISCIAVVICYLNEEYSKLFISVAMVMVCAVGFGNAKRRG